MKDIRPLPASSGGRRTTPAVTFTPGNSPRTAPRAWLMTGQRTAGATVRVWAPRGGHDPAGSRNSTELGRQQPSRSGAIIGTCSASTFRKGSACSRLSLSTEVRERELSGARRDRLVGPLPETVPVHHGRHRGGIPATPAPREQQEALAARRGKRVSYLAGRCGSVRSRLSAKRKVPPGVPAVTPARRGGSTTAG